MTALATPPVEVPSRFSPSKRPSIPFVDPDTGEVLEHRDDVLIDPARGRTLATIIESHGVPIPRFVDRNGGYAATYGWQWKTWSRVLSDAANSDTHRRNLILERTHFAQYDLTGKTLLECGCGAGNDTEVLLGLGLAEVHSFDLSPAVEEAAPLATRCEREPSLARLTLSQADIMRIPYPDRSFDVVYCHRVLQHTPDSEAALRAICKKVKPGGILFAHVYLDDPFMRRHYRHKYRWLFKRLPPGIVKGMLDVTAPVLHRVTHALRTRASRGGATGRLAQEFSHAWIPWAYGGDMWAKLGRAKQIEIEKCITFDMLTAWHDHPMTTERFRSLVQSEGFTIDHGEGTICTARLTRR